MRTVAALLWLGTTLALAAGFQNPAFLALLVPLDLALMA